MGLYQVFHWPNKAPQKSKPWALANLQTGEVNGRWFSTKTKALAAARGLYATLGPKAKMMNEHQRYIAFADTATLDASGITWIHALPAKTFHTMKYGEVPVDAEKLEKFVDNFKNNVRGQDIATDYNHRLDPAKGSKASGWMRDMKVEDNSLMIGVEFTEPAKKELANKEWRYFSLEWDDVWEDNNGGVHTDVVCGGALTNNPIAKGTVPINFSELYELREGSQMPEPTNEVVPQEHAEPGEGSPPAVDNTMNEDDSAGSRLPTRPEDNDGVHSASAEDTTDDGGKMNELEAKLREALGLDEDADIIKAISDVKAETVALSEELGPLREIKKQFAETRAFSEAYPEQAKELEELRKSRIENESRQFAEHFAGSRIKDSEGKTTTKGFSALAIDRVQAMHKSFAEGMPTLADFEGVLAAMTDNGIVDYGEKGTTFSEIGGDNDVPLDKGEARKQFGELVASKMKADGLDPDTATKLVAEEKPALAELALSR